MKVRQWYMRKLEYFKEKVDATQLGGGNASWKTMNMPVEEL